MRFASSEKTSVFEDIISFRFFIHLTLPSCSIWCANNRSLPHSASLWVSNKLSPIRLVPLNEGVIIQQVFLFRA